MEKKIKLVVFDMAGTTIDEDNPVYKTVQKAVNEYGYNVSWKRCCNMEQEKKNNKP